MFRLDNHNKIFVPLADTRYVCYVAVNRKSWVRSAVHQVSFFAFVNFCLTEQEQNKLKERVKKSRAKEIQDLIFFKCKIRKRMGKPWANDLQNDWNLEMNRMCKNEEKPNAIWKSNCKKLGLYPLLNSLLSDVYSVNKNSSQSQTLINSSIVYQKVERISLVFVKPKQFIIL